VPSPGISSSLVSPFLFGLLGFPLFRRFSFLLRNPPEVGAGYSWPPPTGNFFLISTPFPPPLRFSPLQKVLRILGVFCSLVASVMAKASPLNFVPILFTFFYLRWQAFFLPVLLMPPCLDFDLSRSAYSLRFPQFYPVFCCFSFCPLPPISILLKILSFLPPPMILGNSAPPSCQIRVW